MAVAYDNASTAENAGASTSVTFSHTCSGSDRGLLVGVETYDGSVPGTVTATYAGVSMAAEVSTIHGLSDDERLSVLRLEAPASGANNVVATSSDSGDVVAAAVSVTGCHQTDMTRTSTSSAPDAVTAVSNTLASGNANELAVDFIGIYASSATFAASSPSTGRINNNNTTAMQSIGAATQAGAASVTMEWTINIAKSPGHALIIVAEAAAPPATVPYNPHYQRSPILAQ